MPNIFLTDNNSYIQALHRLINTNELYQQLIMGFTELLVNASHYQRLDIVWDGLKDIIMELEKNAKKKGTIH